ncbi:uncharacterized protein [Miscanthus floridulus]|uniref:uncharacterized protein n=1 Tax=Miscanthus floridulus TaxID=154761 RepID=UPI00345881AC
MDADKVAAVAAWPLPHSARGLRVSSACGLLPYPEIHSGLRHHRRPTHASLAAGRVCVGRRCSGAFEALTSALTTGPVLQMPDFLSPSWFDCDASAQGSAPSSTRRRDPSPTFSRPFAAPYIHLAAYERELIGLHQWISKLFGFDFSVEYRPGRLNIVADALSPGLGRWGAAVLVAAAAAALPVSGPSFDLLDAIRRATAAAPDGQQLLAQLQAGELAAPWRLADGLLLHGSRVYVPDQGDLRQQGRADVKV